MRSLFLVAAIFCFTGSAYSAPNREGSNTALSAIRALPRGEYKRIVRIEAREGTPAPERWHIITHDPKDENGVHEYVVAGGELVASRSISQFVEAVNEDDILKESMVKIDSDKLATLAQEFAQANNLNIATLGYALRKEGAEATPLWNVMCMDESGKLVGTLVVSAGKGSVISHQGFTAKPGTAALARMETQAESEADREERRRVQQQRRALVRTAVTPTPAPAKKDDALSRVGNSLNKFFTGRGKP